MKKVILTIAAFLVLALLFVSCGDSGDTDGSQGVQESGKSQSANDPSSSDTSSGSTDNSSITSTDSSEGGETDSSTSGSADGTDDSSANSSTDGSVDSSTDSSEDKTDNSEGAGTEDTECQHRMGAPVTIKEPTCTESGIKAQYCQKCDYFTERRVVPKGHEKIVDKGYASTCVKHGLSDGSHCGVCGAVTEAQKELPLAPNHMEYGFKSVVKEPAIGKSGSAIFACVDCGSETTKTLPPLTTAVVTKSDVYDIIVSRDNPAYDNRWYIFDGKAENSDLWTTGSDWFGNVGDTLTVKLGCEVVLTDLILHCAGNWTTASLTVRDTAGRVTLEKRDIIANGSAFGGESQHLTIFENKNVKAYTIEIKILDNKDNYMGFKVSELEITAAKIDPRMSHTHDYREFSRVVESATCTSEGTDAIACFCGEERNVASAKKPHEYNEISSQIPVSCEVDGQIVYKCVCGSTSTVIVKHRGHIYERLKSYITKPTLMVGGRATYLCVTCDRTEERNLPPLALEGIHYLRVDKVDKDSVTIKFNIYGDPVTYDIRYSTEEITLSNFESATKTEAVVTGTRELCAVLDIKASIDKGYYVAVRPAFGENYGEISTVRVGGNEIIEIDYGSCHVYHGEVVNSFEKMFDEQGLDFLNGSSVPKSVLAQIFTDSSDKELYGMSLSPIIDLEYMHYVSSAYLYYAEAGSSATVRWSRKPLDFMAADSAWDGVYTFTAKAGWNEVKINGEARYIQVIFKDGQAPYEVMLRGYQSGAGDEISEERRPLPTIGEMMGMNGFVAGGNGNTPVESVSCTNVLREYHNLEWTYTLGAYPGQASFFSGWMGNFDSQYSRYSREGITVIPCFQWDVRNVSMSYKVDKNGYPVKNGDAFVRASFLEKFDPNTYFQYADAMFTFAARYGVVSDSWLLDTVKEHTQISGRVGLGCIEWIELGNEPDGGWNGVHNYLSAYQLAALTSAGFDGHCGTIPVTSARYHLGAKNADTNMKVAMAGIADTNGNYIAAMLHWMKANRRDGQISVDAFNVHKYLTKEITLSNGLTVSVGISPEEGDLVGQLTSLLAVRDKYYSDCEVWLSEFGWDTNQSYGTQTSAHAYGEYTGRQVQAMWLTRAYLLLSATGVDKAMMYMCEDVGTVEEEAVGKFATAGVIGFKYDKYGNVVEFKKDSFYYLYTLKNTLGNYAFNEEIASYDQNVKIYRYCTANGEEAYALWCPTSDGTKHDGYKLRVNGDGATLVEAVYGDTDGVEAALEIDEYGYVTVNVSENPIYVVVDKK